MIYFRIIGALIIGYGLLSIFARDFLLRWTVPRSRRATIQRPRWDRVKVLTGFLLIVLGAFVFTVGR